MKRWLVLMWAIQFLMFLGAGISWTVAPTAAFHSLIPLAEGPNTLAIAAIRLLGPFAIATALFTALGQMSTRRMVLQQFSFLFALFLIPWCAVVYYNVYWDYRPGVWSQQVLLVFAPGVVFMLLNFIVGFFSATPPEENTTGYHTTAPSTLWGFWLVQAALLFAGGAVLMFAPLWLVRHLAPHAPPDSIDDVTVAMFRTISSWAFCMAFFTVYGMGRTAWVEIWTSLGRVFGMLFSLLVIASLLAYEPAVITPWLLVVALAFAFLAYANFAMVRRARPEALEDFRRDQIGWTPLDLVAGPMMGLQCFFTKRRASHLMGVGARGRFIVVPESERCFPKNDFFTPDRVFPLQMRFANLSARDDAGLDVRGAAIKLSNDPANSPFDIVLNTGSFTPAKNIVEFAGFVFSKFVPTFGSEILVKGNRTGREGGIAGLRRAPSSYTELHYYGQIVRVWIDVGQHMYLVRYRLVGDPDTESGLPDAADCSHIWLRGRRPDDTRPPNYLRRELRQRLERGPVSLRFQAQFHRAVPGESLSWYNASVDWEEDWVDVGRIVLEAALPDRETEVLQFNPGNQPPSLFTPLSTGLFDYRSMGDSELRVMRRLSALRVWLYGALGLPGFEGGSES